eukprot:s1365_g3.t1
MSTGRILRLALCECANATLQERRGLVRATSPSSRTAPVSTVSFACQGAALPRFGLCPTEPESATAAGAAPGFTMPMRSKDDVLLEEIQFLRQMLADSNEEKRIQVAIVRDEVAEKQRVIDELRSQAIAAQATLQAMKHGREVMSRVESLEAEVELAKGQVLSLQERCRELEISKQHHEAEGVRLKGKLDFWEASDESLAAVSSEPAVSAWDSALREACQSSLHRLADRRVALRVASYKEVAVCKICYDRPVSCALLPCRHHAFCTSCAERVEQSRDQACPICRTAVTGRFDTFSG